MKRKSKSTDWYKKTAELLKLQFVLKKEIPFGHVPLPIVNLKANPPTLTLLSREEFAREKKFEWVDGVIAYPDIPLEDLSMFRALKKRYRNYIEGTFKHVLALLETSHGYATINLTKMKKDDPVIIEGHWQPNKSSTNELEPPPTAMRDEIKISEESPIVGFKNSKDTYYAERIYEIMRIDEKDGTRISLRLNAEKCRGFGAFMQSLIEKDKMKYYQTTEEDKDKIAFANVSRASSSGVALLFPIFFASEDTPPLSLLGYDYGRKYFNYNEMSPAIFNKKDGYALPYEIVLYTCYVLDFYLQQSVELNLPKEDMKEILNKIDKNGVSIIYSLVRGKKFPFYLKAQEKNKIQKYIDKKCTHFEIVIDDTPAILRMKYAVAYGALSFPSLSQYVECKNSDKISKSHQLIKLIIYPIFESLNFLDQKISDKENIKNCFSYLSNQFLYFTIVENIFSLILNGFQDKTPKEDKMRKILKTYKKEYFTSIDASYPASIRNAAVNCHIGNLLFLIMQNKALDINNCAPNGKTALHYAVGYKTTSVSKHASKSKVALLNDDSEKMKKLITCFILLEFKADPHIKDSKGKTAFHILEEQKEKDELNFLFQRTETRQSDYAHFKKAIDAESARQGFFGDWSFQPQSSSALRFKYCLWESIPLPEEVLIAPSKTLSGSPS